MASTDPISKYYSSLAETYDLMADALKTATDRGLKVSSALIADIQTGQKEALSFASKAATDPDPSAMFSGLLESATAAQGRAFAFTELFYKEALGAGEDARETVSKLVKANEESVKLASELSKSFSSSNPLMDAWQKGVEAFTPGSKPAARKTPAAV